MAHIVILGRHRRHAGGQMRATLDKSHRITVVNALDHFQFVPSNPWLAVGWRQRGNHPAIAPAWSAKASTSAQRVPIDAEGSNALELADASACPPAPPLVRRSARARP